MRFARFILPAAAALLAALAACGPARPRLTVFYAAAFEPVLHTLLPAADRALNCTIGSETGGSGNLLRKKVELGRACDLMLLADGTYFGKRGNGLFTWRLEFAGDEMVLAVGQRAPRPDAAEKNWLPVLLDPGVRLGRADETISPLGARTRLLWQRRERRGTPGLEHQLLAKTVLTADDAGTLAARLKAGDLDYAFLYRTTCLMQDIRFIRLDPELRLAEPADPDAIRYALSIPRDANQPEKSEALLRFLLHSKRPLWEEKGFLPVRPRFFGDPADYNRFKEWADYGGAF
jgi:ABC-type molybdate transport system substrate-binding protein